jgi:DNA-binding CsgD family transcriptional regulator
MPKYLIERHVPGAGKLSQEDLRSLAARSVPILDELGIQWLESYIVADKIYCVYIAPNVAGIDEHARRLGFPASKIAAVRAVIDPTTAEAELTARETQVLRLAAQGHSRRAMAAALCISEATVRHHLEHIYQKIGTSTRGGYPLRARTGIAVGVVAGPPARSAGSPPRTQGENGTIVRWHPHRRARRMSLSMQAEVPCRNM